MLLLFSVCRAMAMVKAKATIMSSVRMLVTLITFDLLEKAEKHPRIRKILLFLQQRIFKKNRVK